MRRLGRVALARWWVPLLIGLLGLGAGVVAIRARNDGIKPVFEVQALYAVPPAASSGLRETQSYDSLRSAVERAIEANEELLAESKGNATITSEQENFSIVFAARGRDPESATALAEELRNNFVVAEFGAVEINARMELLLADAIEVKQALDALEPVVATTAPEVVLDATTQARLDFLLIQVGALTSESARLVGDLVLAETGEDRNGTPAQIQEQIDSVKDKLEAIYLELATIPTYDPSMLDAARSEGPRGSQEASTGASETAPRTGGEGAPTATNRDELFIPDDEDLIGPEWDSGALEDRYAELQAGYEALFIDSLNGETGELDPVRVQETTPSLIPPVVAGGAGFGLGALLAMAGIFLINRVRKPFFVPGDLAPLVVLAEIPILEDDSGGRRANRRLQQRKRAIQQFRGSMIGVLESRSAPMAIGLSGLKTAPNETRAVATELAASLGAADRNVLVIDVDFRPVQAPIAAAGGITLAGILDLARVDQEAANSQLKQVLNDVPEDHGTWRLLPAGNLGVDPTDVILSRPFGQLLAEAVTHTDLVLVRVPEEGTATLSDSLYQRLDGIVAVCRSRSTRERDLVSLASRLEDRRAELLGGVLLVGKRSRSGGRLTRLNPRGGLSSLWATRARRRQKANSPVAKSGNTEDTRSTGARASLATGLGEPAKSPGQTKPVAANKSAASFHRMKSRLARARVRVRMPTSSWRSLPDFLVVGAQRSGTSSLYKYLGQHPSVVPSIRKETEFLTFRHSEGERWYKAHFPISRGANHSDGGRRLTFEADPSYLLDPRAPLRASLLVPDAKIIVLLRDPVARAISHYNHNVRIGQEHATLAEALDLEQDRLQGEVEKMAQDPEYPAKQFLRYSYATRGMYAEQLERWLEFYPSDRVRVVHSQDLFSNTAAVFNWLLEFLELPAWQLPTFGNFSYTGDANDNGRVRIPDRVVVDRLKEQFAPHNERLYDLIDQDFGW